LLNAKNPIRLKAPIQQGQRPFIFTGANTEITFVWLSLLAGVASFLISTRWKAFGYIGSILFLIMGVALISSNVSYINGENITINGSETIHTYSFANYSNAYSNGVAIILIVISMASLFLTNEKKSTSREAR